MSDCYKLTPADLMAVDSAYAASDYGGGKCQEVIVTGGFRLSGVLVIAVGACHRASTISPEIWVATGPGIDVYFHDAPQFAALIVPGDGGTLGFVKIDNDLYEIVSNAAPTFATRTEVREIVTMLTAKLFTY
jgi:hypothetical protein